MLAILPQRSKLLMASSLLSPSLQDAVSSQDHTPLIAKYCSKCKQHLPISEFTLDRHSLDGLKQWCKACRSFSEQKRRDKKRTSFQSITSAAIYFIANEYKLEHIKIGFTTSFYSRFKDHLCSTSGNILLLSLIEATSKEDEYLLHQQFKPFQINPEGEWFLAKAPILRHLSTLDQSLAHQAASVLTPCQKSRIIVPTISHYIDALPFL